MMPTRQLPINKKTMLLPGIGIVVFAISVMGMLFMKGSKPPSTDLLAQATSQDVKENDDINMKQMGTSTVGIEKTRKDKKEKLTTKLPAVYKQNATTIFKPLSSNEIDRKSTRLNSSHHSISY